MLFEFLVKEYGFSAPTHRQGKQDNGVVIVDELIYNNPAINQRISLSNAYHPVDYGFELNLYSPSISAHSGDRNMIYYVLKEDQNYHQSYLVEAAIF